ncbi:hypothetical protein Pmani_008963 [Petrolisthes manimaculis]|uniref:Uncharacterized protein n=1 Tax=Petrolisthes manimaculis TaxID=1843537 RepID=A0AAE1Q4G7_9EUCA|nr:hypothetical protein Pmani_015601 [Petrolisthes manimaculis]KAK4320154.1 hypothetical protein Pmani_008963 [Petrolisthes manimaculis]
MIVYFRASQHLTFTTLSHSSNSNMDTKSSLLVLTAEGCQQHIRLIADWNNKRHGSSFTQKEQIVVSLSVGIFIIYFLWLREPSDIDENMSLPVWKRVPGIDPETAQGMMEMDKHLGLQVDYKALEEYKKEYYAKKALEIEKELQEEKRHRELKTSMSSHMHILKRYEQKPENTEGCPRALD